MRIERIGDAVLCLGRCEDVLPTLDRCDAILTDPPYGIGASKAQAHSRIRDRDSWSNDDDGWDDEAPIETVQSLVGLSDHLIIWGGQYFGLPPTSKVLVWDKLNPKGFSLSDVEIAWTSLPGATRMWKGLSPRQGVDDKSHPTQKPLDLMSWCIERLPSTVRTILDPYAGSGTTGVACVRMGKRFTGIEKSPKYFDVMCRRIEEAYRQPADMFIAPSQPKPIQAALL